MIDTVLRLLRKGRVEADGLDIFSSLLFDSTLDDSLHGLNSERLARFASEAFTFVLKKTHKRHSINVRATDLLSDAAVAPANAASQPHAKAATVIEILNDDMPFLVESVMGELHSRGLRPLLVFHPIFKVKRYGSGRLNAVTGPGDRNWASGDQESYMAAVVEGLDPAAVPDLVAALDGVLDDVRLAATDADAMRARLQQATGSYEALPLSLGATGLGAANQGGVAPGELQEAVEFLKWLLRGHFTLLGIRDYEFIGTEQQADLWPVTNGALGILRTPELMVLRRGSERLKVTPEIRAFIGSPTPLIISKASAVSHVRERSQLDYIGIKRYGPHGSLVGELRVVGLFTAAAYLQPVEAVPVIRQKVRKVLAAAQFPADSHSGRTLIDILEHFPRDELFHIDMGHLQSWSMVLLDLSLRPRIRVLARRDSFERYYSVLVFVPRDLYSSAVRERIGRYLAETFNGRVAAFYPYISNAPLVRTQFIIGLGVNEPRDVPDAALEHDIGELLRTWPDRLGVAISARVAGAASATSTTPTAAATGGAADAPALGPAAGGPGAAARLTAAYATAFPAGYTETFSVERAVDDIARIERLGPARPVAIDFYRGAGSASHQLRAAVYRFDTPIPLSERVPLLEHLGLRVIDERSYHVRPLVDGHVRDVILHDMVLETAAGTPIDLTGHDRMEDCFLAVFHGLAENDPFNALVVTAGLDWREAAIFRSYAAYLRQIRAPFGPRYIAETLVEHAGITRDLYELFRARLDPDQLQSRPARARAVAELTERIETALVAVPSLEQDRILRRILNLVLATLRTNVFVSTQRTAPGPDRQPDTMAFKFAPDLIDGMPEPKPHREIFVASPRLEGIHLRFAPIARGGIRWSDRPQDFRTEILGLAKAQQVKNTVIVPSGAKGGFVPKLQSRTASRDDIAAEGLATYRIFIETLLSLTDNIEPDSESAAPDFGAREAGEEAAREAGKKAGLGGHIVKPARVVCHDGDDPYLVVAADKGTATFSDTANAIAMRRGFWLGDAFASGGSTGYDHKKIGITAQGAWECVRRHFREIDVDIQTTPFTVVGVGDMSGDVFGNAMLLSPSTRLIAAFDHRDIFIDPAPDPAISLMERQRLFALPRSSWRDYDPAKISPGGGVASRSAKSITLSPQAQAALGITAAALTPGELMQAILRCAADLLWFGGIGSFIRASTEIDEQVGDRANDGIRIAADEVRARVIGEGANLALTQRGRIEAASRGVRLNTDFIDNSAGVDTSDREVNLKIALAPAVVARRLAPAGRDKLLAQMRDDVAAGVLVNNRQQALALSLAERTSVRDIAHLGHLARRLEARGLITRRLEALPSGAEFLARAAATAASTTTAATEAGKVGEVPAGEARARAGLTRPELAVLLAWSKIALNADLLAAGVPDEPVFEPLLVEYFPSALRDTYAADIRAHRLRREIIATRLTNSLINRGGPALIDRIAEATGRDAAEIAHAFMAARAIFDLPAIWTAIEALDDQVPRTIGGQTQLDLYQTAQELLVEQTVKVLERRDGREFANLTETYRPAAEMLTQTAFEVAAPRQRAELEAEAGRLRAKGVPEDLARRIAGLVITRQAIALADGAARAGSTPAATARVIFGAAEYLRIDDFRARAATMKPADEFDSQATEEALAVLSGEHQALMQRMLQVRAASPTATGGIADVSAWIAANTPRLAAAKPMIDAVLAPPEMTVSRLSVIAGKIRGATAA